jgi:hypothetical protein
MGAEEERGRGFRVEDRRRFSPTSGESRSSTDSSDQTPEGAFSQEPESSSASHSQASYPASPSPAEISFSSFILGLTTQALIYMGEIPPAPDQPTQTDLSAAQQMIDVLGMLKQKTKGNLDAGEEAMLGNALFDLRMRYVDIVKQRREAAQEKERK